MGWVIVFNAAFRNMSVISWRSALLLDESGIPRENHRPGASDWQILLHNVLSSTPRHERDSNTQLYEWYALFVYVVLNLITIRTRPAHPPEKLFVLYIYFMKRWMLKEWKYQNSITHNTSTTEWNKSIHGTQGDMNHQFHISHTEIYDKQLAIKCMDLNEHALSLIHICWHPVFITSLMYLVSRVWLIALEFHTQVRIPKDFF